MTVVLLQVHEIAARLCHKSPKTSSHLPYLLSPFLACLAYFLCLLTAYSLPARSLAYVLACFESQSNPRRSLPAITLLSFPLLLYKKTRETRDQVAKVRIRNSQFPSPDIHKFIHYLSS
jgi:hypothetical protein